MLSGCNETENRVPKGAEKTFPSTPTSYSTPNSHFGLCPRPPQTMLVGYGVMHTCNHPHHWGDHHLGAPPPPPNTTGIERAAEGSMSQKKPQKAKKKKQLLARLYTFLRETMLRESLWLQGSVTNGAQVQ